MRPAARSGMTGRALTLLGWALALVQVLTIQPAQPFSFPEPLSPEHWALVALFVLTSLPLATGRARPVVVLAHALVVAVVLALHPLTAFGRDGSAVILMIWLGAVLRRLPIRRQWVLLYASTMVALLAGEALMAAFRPPDVPVDLPDYGAVMGEYGDCGFLRPGLDTEVVGEDGPARFVTNSLGLRYDREVVPVPPDGTLRILLLGDSFVAGYRTDQTETFGARLEARLATRLRRPVEVLPAGTGYPGATLQVAPACSARVHPARWLVGITLGNDLSQSWFEERGMPASVLDGLFLPPDASKSRLGLLPVQLLRSIRSWRVERRVEALVEPEVISSWYHDAPTSVHLFDPGHSLGHFFIRRTLDPVEESYAATARDLIAIAHAGSDAGTAVTFVFFPQRFQVSDREWRATLFEYGLDPDAFDPDAPNRRLAAICRDAGLSCLDLLPALRAAAAGGPLYQRRGDMHWNRRGQDVAAAAVADELGAAGVGAPATTGGR